jgi:O-antigen ligase
MSLLPSPAVRAVTALLGAVCVPPAAAAVVLGSPLAAAVLLAAAAVPAIVTTPTLALLLLVVGEVSNLSEGIGSHAGLSVYLASFGLAVAALLIGIRRGTARLVWSPVYIFAGLFVVTRALTVEVARYPDLAWADSVESAKALAFLVVVTSLICSTDSHLKVAQALTVTAVLMAGLSVLQDLALHNGSSLYGLSNVAASNLSTTLDPGLVTGRESGPESDPNFWARSLLLFLPLGLSLLATSARGRSRGVFWAACVGIMFFGLLLTGSRGGLIAAGVFIVVWLILAGSVQRRLLLVTPLIFGVLFAVPGIGSRLGTLAELKQSNAATFDPSLAGRVATQHAGLRMVSDHPVLGVGAANYEKVVISYAREAGYALAVPLAAHNLYLQMAAEGGVIGFAGWVLFYAAAIFVATRAFLLAGGTGRGSPQRWLAVGVLAALAGYAVASVFLHLSHLRVLLVVVALGAALDANLTRRGTASVEFDGGRSRLDPMRVSMASPAPWRLRMIRPNLLRTSRSWFAPLLPTAVASLILITGLSTLELLGQLSRPMWESTVGGLVSVSNNRRSAGNAYEYDALTRNLVIPTEAAVLSSPRFRADALTAAKLTVTDARKTSISVTSAPTSAFVYVTARSPRQDVAERLATATFDAGRNYVNRLTPIYVMEPASSVASRLQQQTLWGNIATVAVLAGLVDVLWRGWRRHRRRAPSLTT